MRVALIPDRARRLVRLGAKFGVVGLSSVGVYFAALYVLDPRIPSTLALTAICYLLSAIYNYLLQSRFTFQVRTSPRAASRYAAMHALCLALNSTLMLALVDLGGAGLFPAQVLATGIVAAVSFTLSSQWVYR